jgi:penicillin-insensitive murein endopeptidase
MAIDELRAALAVMTWSFGRRRKLAIVIAAFGLAGLATWWWGNDFLRAFESDRPSRSHGTTSEGRLERGKRLPTSGPNFHAYSRLGALLGRNAVHSTVRDIVLAAYDSMAVLRPDVEFVYGETGWPSGGPFPPHRTHENGTSVDLFVPVLDAQGKPAVLPIRPWNKFGYSIEFDAEGRWQGYRIDFETLALHLLVLDAEARNHGARVGRVILAPEFKDELEGSPAGRRALATLPWMKGSPWVRHDEHYHVDFELPD